MKESKDQKILFIIGLIPVIWIALLIAPSISGGLPTIIKDFPKTILFALKDISAVSSTIHGLFPPSSNTQGIIFSAHF